MSDDTHQSSPDFDYRAFSIGEARKLLGNISRSHLYTLVTAGKVEAHKARVPFGGDRSVNSAVPRFGETAMTRHRKRPPSQPNAVGQGNMAHPLARALFALRLDLKALDTTLSADDAIAHPSGHLDQ